MPRDARGIHTAPGRAAETARKVSRVADLARRENLAGIVLSAQHNFVWLTAGRSNRIDSARETGSASLLVTADGRRFVLANAIEAPRMAGETLDGLGFELVTYPWADERAHPALPFECAARAIGTGPFGMDVGSPFGRPVESHLSALRCQLDPDELPRYRRLGATCGRQLGAVARAARRGMSENEIARLVSAALGAHAVRTTVLLVGADERIDRYRHPVPTAKAWEERLLIVVCAEREGQVVALSRLVSVTEDSELARRTRATAEVYAALIGASVPAATGAAIFAAATAAYAAAGFPGEEVRHHQGGAIGYRSREWIAHPASTDVVTPPQAFAWNPSITGTKIEDTCLVLEDGSIELITTTPDWPGLDVEVRGQHLRLANVLVSGG
jgi:Xaa-Pro aminopeptidase